MVVLLTACECDAHLLVDSEKVYVVTEQKTVPLTAVLGMNIVADEWLLLLVYWVEVYGKGWGHCVLELLVLLGRPRLVKIVLLEEC